MTTRTDFETMNRMFMNSMMESYSRVTSSVTMVATEREHDLLKKHGWTYNDFIAENKRVLDEFMKTLR